MNWKVFDKTLRDFAEEQCLELSVEDFNHFYGQITCYKLIETDSIFYEVRHAKPLEEYGSKFRICSKIQAGSLSIKSRGPFFGKVKVSIS